MADIEPILSHDVLEHWEAIEPKIRRVLTRVDNGYRAQDVLTFLQRMEMQLWKVNDWQAIAVTQITNLPLHNALTVVYCSGDGVHEWFDDLMDMIESFAVDNKCKYVEVHGRKGWEKVGKARGYRTEMIYIRKKFDG